VLSIAVLSACATSGVGRSASGIPEELRSGFLQDYSRLEPIAGKQAVFLWVNPEVDFGKYTHFLVEPVDSVVPPAYRASLQPNPDVVAAVTDYFRGALIRELGSQYEIVDRPGKDVARISVAITAIQPTAKQLSAWQYLPIPLLVTSVGEITGNRERDVVVYMEGEITDSVNGQLLMELMKGRVSEQGGARRIEDITAATVKPVLDFWAREHLRLVQDAQTTH